MLPTLPYKISLLRISSKMAVHVRGGGGLPDNQPVILIIFVIQPLPIV